MSPIIILGGGLWGSLLAYRLKKTLPDVEFRLLEPTNVLGDGLSWTFHQSDIPPETREWLTPFTDYHWPSFQVNFPKTTKEIDSAYFLISAKRIEEILVPLLGERLVMNASIDMEKLLEQNAFVIDTRSITFFETRAFHKVMELEVDLVYSHNLRRPVTLDSSVSQEEGFRFLQYFPLSPKSLLLRDVRYCATPKIMGKDFEEEMLDELAQKGHRLERVKRKESHIQRLPKETFFPRHEGRILRLSGIHHEMTGDALPDAVKLIDLMVKTSFRLGELREVIADYISLKDRKKRYYRSINKRLYHSVKPESRYLFYQGLYSLPASIREKFYSGEMELIDICKALIGTPLEVKLPMLVSLRSLGASV